MIEPQCPECGSESVLARRPNNQHGIGIVPVSRTYWRCSICRRPVHRGVDKFEYRRGYILTERTLVKIDQIAIHKWSKLGLLLSYQPLEPRRGGCHGRDSWIAAL